MSGIEIAGVLVSALAVWLTARRHMTCWPVGLLSVALYAWIFRDAKLYSDMLLQGAFAIMQVYGWWRWCHPDARAQVDDRVDVRVPTWRLLLLGLGAGAAGSVVLGLMMSVWTDAALPWMDAALSAFSLVAQYWTARRFIASWRLWVVLDLIYVGMFLFKGLYPTALLYAGFVVLALAGWRSWRRVLMRGNLPGGARADAAVLQGAFAPSPIFPNTGARPPTGRTLRFGESDAEASGLPGATGRPFGQSGQFGVHGPQAERDWPLMILSELASVLSSYRIAGEIEAISWHSPRPFAAAALVTLTTGETLFVKRHHQRLRDVAALAEEHRFIAHLQRQGIAVVQVLGDRLGRTAIQIGEWTYEVHGVGEGEDLYRDIMSWEPFQRVEHAYIAGAALARLHRAARGYEAPARPPRLLLSSYQVIGASALLPALENWVAAQPLLQEALAMRPWREEIVATIGPWHAQLVPLLEAHGADAVPGLAPLWTHGDWHASNLLWSSTGTAGNAAAQGPRSGQGPRRDVPGIGTVLDFGLADRTCALVDLALAIERNTIEWLVQSDARPVHLDQIDALLDGYHSVMPLTKADMAALVALLPIVHTEFALSEVGYFAGVLHLAEAAAVAYDDYLLGHARWFTTPSGAAVLAHLRGWRGTTAT
jgi:nicotinamide mononucleotide transporter PnuC